MAKHWMNGGSCLLVYSIINEHVAKNQIKINHFQGKTGSKWIVSKNVNRFSPSKHSMAQTKARQLPTATLLVHIFINDTLVC